MFQHLAILLAISRETFSWSSLIFDVNVLHNNGEVCNSTEPALTAVPALIATLVLHKLSAWLPLALIIVGINTPMITNPAATAAIIPIKVPDNSAFLMIICHLIAEELALVQNRIVLIGPAIS